MPKETRDTFLVVCPVKADDLAVLAQALQRVQLARHLLPLRLLEHRDALDGNELEVFNVPGFVDNAAAACMNEGNCTAMSTSLKNAQHYCINVCKCKFEAVQHIFYKQIETSKHRASPASYAS